MSENTESKNQGGNKEPAPTGNPGTRGGSDNREIRRVPTGNYGTYSEDPPRKKKI
jgi:hypothetical protein